MKLMMTIRIPVEHGNKAIADGSMQKAFENLIERIKPLSAYFSMLDGYRAAYFVYELEEEYHLVELHEPMFAAMGALIDERPVLDWGDLQRAINQIKPA